MTDPGTTRPPRTSCGAAAPHPYPGDLVRRHGDDGAFPAPAALRALDLDLPGRKAEYLHAVAEAALDGRLDDEVTERYGRPVAEVSQRWRPFRTWAAVHLRALREQRTHEIGG